jgi:hypothetical protein
MYRADFESTVETLAEVLSALLAELPGALPFFRDFHRHVSRPGLRGRAVVGIPQSTWTSFFGASTRVGGRPLYLAAREWMTWHRHAGQPVVTEALGGAYDSDRGLCKAYRVNLPWCDGDPFVRVEELVERDSRPNVVNCFRMLRPRLARARRRAGEWMGERRQWEDEHYEQFSRTAVHEVWHALLSRRGRKPELIRGWPAAPGGADIAAWWPRLVRPARGKLVRPRRAEPAAQALPAARAEKRFGPMPSPPYLLVNVGWGLGPRDPKLAQLKEVGWIRGAQCAVQQYLCLRRPPADFLDQAREWGVDVVSFPWSVSSRSLANLEQATGA